MFLHNLKYDFLVCLRSKDVLFWLILFPIFLSTIFKVAFGNLSELTRNFYAVPTAVVTVSDNGIFTDVLGEVSKGENALLSVTYTDEEKALEMLEKEEVSGIIYVDNEISVTVSGISNGTTANIKKTIIKSFVERYNVTAEIVMDTLANNPEMLASVAAKLSKEVKCNENISLTNGNTDGTLMYFYNLIAMVGLLGSNMGIYIAIDAQANLSPLGARKNCSPIKKSVSLSASLISRFLEQAVCVIIAITYVVFVLGVDFGDNIPMVYLSGIIGGMVGVSFGFFIGSFGNMSESMKSAISTGASLISCFFSGLMISNMKGLMDMYIPWFNKINPAAVISDTFYCLNIYDNYDRFFEKIITMLIMIFIFSAGGFLLTRRRKYASL